MYQTNLRCSKCNKVLFKGSYSISLVEVRCTCGNAMKLQAPTKENYKDYQQQRKQRIAFQMKKQKERYGGYHE